MIGAAGVVDRHAADQAVGRVHGDGAHRVLAEVLGDLDASGCPCSVVDARVRELERGVDLGQLARAGTRRRRPGR